MTGKLPPWASKDSNAVVLRMWMDGAQARDIAEAFGVSRNAVIGRAHRIGAPPRPNPTVRNAPQLPDEAFLAVARAVGGGKRLRDAARDAGMSERAAQYWRDQNPLRWHDAKNGAARVLRAVPKAPEPPLRIVRRIGGGTLPPTVRAAPTPPEKPVFAAPPRPVGRDRDGGCRWPYGIPGTKEFQYCCAPGIVPGKSYCVEHYKIAYVRPKHQEAAG